MSLTMHSASVTTFDNMLRALIHVINKAKAHCEAKKINPEALTTARLFPDMFPFWHQCCLVSDFAKGAVSRLAGVEVPSWADDQRTFDELIARLEKTRDYIKGFGPEKLEGADAKPITLKIGGQDMTITGEQYLLNMATPNFYFHVTTAYNILRKGGVEVGKRDFLGRA
ncbi:DUF1993 domain-containing protein [Terrarubrum flagellatum]|uniref:DUF1993 domain-containing protein n=1 Tax=Terrirubrum flagellatum TaxID=2895980 RepID=UPI0031450984